MRVRLFRSSLRHSVRVGQRSDIWVCRVCKLAGIGALERLQTDAIGGVGDGGESDGDVQQVDVPKADSSRLRVSVRSGVEDSSSSRTLARKTSLTLWAPTNGLWCRTPDDSVVM